MTVQTTSPDIQMNPQQTAQIQTQVSPPDADTKRSTRNGVIIVIMFFLGIYVITKVFSNLPEFSEEDLRKLKTHGWSGYFPGPKTLADVKEIKAVIMQYKDDYFDFVVGSFSALYIFMQIFAIPGTIFLSVLAGPLFNTWLGLAIVSLCATSGSTLSFLLSKLLGRPLMMKYIPKKIETFNQKISEQRKQNNLFWYILFLRMTPILPNVFINLVSPIVGVPVIHFFGATLFGLMPANYLHVNSGLILSELSDEGLGPQLFWTALKVAVIGCLALLPTLFKKKLQDKAGLADINKQN